MTSKNLYTRIFFTAIYSLIYLATAISDFSAAESSSDIPRKRFISTSELLQKAEHGNAEAQNDLGFRYQFGIQVPQSGVEAAKWYRKAAESGLAEAQANMGIVYSRGIGVPEDYNKAFEWYLKAAEQGFAQAQYELGLRYNIGRGVTRNIAESFRWFSIASKQYDVETRSKDGSEAVKWHEASVHCANQAQLMVNLIDSVGSAKDQFNVGLIYKFDCDVKDIKLAKNDIEAAKCFRKAAEKGYADAQSMLGDVYEGGEGVVKDMLEAVKWWRKAANQGNAYAQFNLGGCYAYGHGVPKDFSEAYKWLLLAGAQGHEGADKLIGVTESQMTAVQRAEGQRAAREFSLKTTPSIGGNVSEAASAMASPKSVGTGFFITEDGYFITNQHVAGSVSKIKVITSTGVVEAEVVKVDKVNDLSLLKANGRFAAVPLISSARVRLGATAFTVGFPNPDLQGFTPKLAKGEIAGLAGARDDPRHFQISTPIQPGSSGGALVDERGNVVGVVVARLSQKAAIETSGAFAENVNYAVKSSYVLSFLETLPDVVVNLKERIDATRKFEDVVTTIEQATVMVLVY